MNSLTLLYFSIYHFFITIPLSSSPFHGVGDGAHDYVHMCMLVFLCMVVNIYNAHTNVVKHTQTHTICKDT